jgi:putative RNA 2'-phosphotransferase
VGQDNLKVIPMTKPSMQVAKLAKFLSYVLGRRPDEFGIVPDAEGYVGIKALLQALHEEPGWRHIRMVHFNEVLMTLANPAIEIEGSRIRAIEKYLLPVASLPEKLPNLLYIAIRPRAYPAALDKGLSATPHPHLILSKDAAMAMRMGRRHDNNPTLLTVQVAESINRGTCFRQYGQLLFLADMIYAGTFTGPALPKEKPDGAASSAATKAPHAKTPGSYYPDLDSAQAVKYHITPGIRRKEPEWQKSRRQARRHKADLNK